MILFLSALGYAGSLPEGVEEDQAAAIIVIERCYYPVLLKEAKRINIRTLMCSGLINFLLLNDNFLMQRSFGLSF